MSVLVVDDELFYRGRDQEGIYRFFRGSTCPPIRGRIVRPTGQRDTWVHIQGAYSGQWQHLGCRSEEHTSELQSQSNLVCRLLLEKKNRQRVRAGRGALPEDAL